MYQNETIVGTLPYPSCIFLERSNRKYRNEYGRLLLYSGFYLEGAQYHHQREYKSEKKINRCYDVYDAVKKHDAYRGGFIYALSIY